MCGCWRMWNSLKRFCWVKSFHHEGECGWLSPGYACWFELAYPVLIGFQHLLNHVRHMKGDACWILELPAGALQTEAPIWGTCLFITRMSFRFAWTECVFHISQNWRLNCKREYSLKYELTLSCATVLWGGVVCCHLGAQSKPTHWSTWHSCAASTKVWLSPQHKVFNVGSSKWVKPWDCRILCHFSLCPALPLPSVHDCLVLRINAWEGVNLVPSLSNQVNHLKAFTVPDKSMNQHFT